MLNHGDDVRGVTTSCAFGVIRVNRAVLEGFDRLLNESRFVQRICVDKTLYVVLIADAQTAVNGCRSGSPVFVQLQADRTGGALLLQWFLLAIVAFARDAKVEW